MPSIIAFGLGSGGGSTVVVPPSITAPPHVPILSPITSSGDLGAGEDVSTVPQLDPTFTPITGRRSIVENVYRRLQTPLGALSFHPEFGEDLRQFLLSAMTSAKLRDVKRACEAQAQQEQRITAATASVSYDDSQQALTASLALQDADGPFSLTLFVTKLDVALLDSV